jgi:hypothetical protein
MVAAALPDLNCCHRIALGLLIWRRERGREREIERERERAQEREGVSERERSRERENLG